MELRLCALLALAFVATVATAQQAVPSDNDLRTAYCVPVIKAGLDFGRQAIAQTEANSNSPIQEVQHSNRKLLDNLREAQAKTQDVLDRLQLYLLPKTDTLDPIALAGATHRGEADMAALNRCAAKCPAAVPLDQQQACMTSCVGTDLVARIQACRNPTWLPF